MNVVCFLEDPAAAFKEVWRVLKDGGSVLVGFIDGESFLGKLYRANKETSLFYREAIFHTPAEILSILQAAGFADFA
ncbi:methyltransferase domain-containing protein [Geobacter sp.]|uniref:methyltransferase domain-containing protein n=1 Tax=Geobacter sp. TaxID=46610 RepID=UPI002621B0C0|nr:methyltransferase domain-containing protein [Geobacter sp.]